MSDPTVQRAAEARDLLDGAIRSVWSDVGTASADVLAANCVRTLAAAGLLADPTKVCAMCGEQLDSLNAADNVMSDPTVQRAAEVMAPRLHKRSRHDMYPTCDLCVTDTTALAHARRMIKYGA